MRKADDLVRVVDPRCGRGRWLYQRPEPLDFDPARGVFVFADGLEMAREHVRAVAALQIEREVEKSKSVHSPRRDRLVPQSVSSVILVPAKLPDDLRATLADVARRREPGQGGRITSSWLLPVDELGTVVVYRTDPQRAWTTAERIAKAAGLPMLDLLGMEPVYREPHELDLPLGQRLAQRGVPLEPLPLAPPICAVKRDERSLEVSWPAQGRALFPRTVYRLLPPPRFLLAVDGQRAQLRRRKRAIGEIPVGGIEAVRFDEQGVSLVGDRTMVRCPLDDWDAAIWLCAAVEHHLWTLQAAQPGFPYR